MITKRYDTMTINAMLDDISARLASVDKRELTKVSVAEARLLENIRGKLIDMLMISIDKDSYL